MVALEPKDLTWIKEQQDDPEDLCAHGKVEFEIDGTTFLSAEDGE